MRHEEVIYYYVKEKRGNYEEHNSMSPIPLDKSAFSPRLLQQLCKFSLREREKKLISESLRGTLCTAVESVPLNINSYGW